MPIKNLFRRRRTFGIQARLAMLAQRSDDIEWGTDHYDFLLEGVPTLVAIQEEGNYLENYHATSDSAKDTMSARDPSTRYGPDEGPLSEQSRDLTHHPEPEGPYDPESPEYEDPMVEIAP